MHLGPDAGSPEEGSGVTVSLNVSISGHGYYSYYPVQYRSTLLCTLVYKTASSCADGEKERECCSHIVMRDHRQLSHCPLGEKLVMKKAAHATHGTLRPDKWYELDQGGTACDNYIL